MSTFICTNRNTVQYRGTPHYTTVLRDLSLQSCKTVLVAPRHNLVAVTEADPELANSDDLRLGVRSFLRRINSQVDSSMSIRYQHETLRLDTDRPHLVAIASHDVDVGREVAQLVELLLRHQIARA